jgi:GNAT superfamily N-acetyltransferase
MRDLVIRAADAGDLDAIAALFERENERPPNREFIAACVEYYPSAVALQDGKALGFIYCQRFAPDILEIANLLVAGDSRGMGVGSGLLAKVETLADTEWASLILVHSLLYPHPPRRSPAAFYGRHGFAAIHRTAASTVYAKAL